MKRISDPKRKAHIIAQHNLRDVLSEELLDAYSLRSFSKGEYIYYQDDQPHTFYILVKGRLQIDYLHTNGSQTIFSFAEPVSTLGELEIFESFPAIKNVLAMKECLLLAAPMDTVRKLGSTDPRFLRFLLHNLVTRLDFSSNQLAQIALPLENRLVRYLYGRMNTDGSTFTLEKRETMAGILGTSVRHLNRTLKTLGEKGILRLHNKTLTILDAKKLTSLIR